MNSWLLMGIGILVGVLLTVCVGYLFYKYRRPVSRAVKVKLNESVEPCYVVSVLAVRRPLNHAYSESKNVTFGSRLVKTGNVEKASEIAIQDFVRSNFLSTDDHEFLTAVAPVVWQVDFAQNEDTVTVSLNLQTLSDSPEYTAVANLIQSHRHNFKKIVDGLDYSRSPSFMSANDRTGQDYLNN